MVNKLHKILITIFAVVFVTLMIAWPMTLQSVTAGQGYVDHRWGISYCYENFVKYGGANGSDVPSYMECMHTDLNGYDDMMVGVGVYTFYDTNVQYYYNYGNWWFSTQAGAWGINTVSFMPPMGMTFDLDFGLPSASHLVYYDYSSGQWLTYYWYYFNGWHKEPFDPAGSYNDYVLYVGDQYNWNFGDRTSAAGMTQGAFYYNNNPYTVYYHYAQTQVPPGHSIPSGISPYAFLTAHPYSYKNPQGYGDW